MGSGAARPVGTSDSQHAGQPARVIAFVALLVIFVIAISLAPVWIVAPVADTTARIAGSLIAVVGIENIVDANLIYLGSRTLLVGRDCTAAYLIAVYAALVLTYPSTRRDKLIAFGVGVPGLLVINMARLVGAGVVAEYLPTRFDLIHDYIFQVLLALSVLLVWLAWIARLRTHEA